MNLNQLKYLTTIAEERNISKAAQKLYVSQPSLSQFIRNIEAELGVKLFDRSSTPIKITYAGELYIKWAKDMLNSSERIHKEIADIAGLKKIKLTIGVSTYRSTYILPKVIKTFKEFYPESYIIIEEHPTPYLHKLLDANKIDLLIDMPHPDSITYKSIPLIKENILVEIPKEYGSFDGEVSLVDFSNKPFVMISEEQRLGKITRDLCDKSHFTPTISCECRNVETAHALANQGLGIAFIPEFFVNSLNDKSNFYKLKELNPNRQFCVIYNNKRYLSKADEKFIQILDEFLNCI